MRTLVVLLLAAVAAPATADLWPGGSGERAVLYELYASAYEQVAPGYFATTLSITNVTGDASFDVNSVEIALGTNGALHNEQAFGGFAKGATLREFQDLPGFTSAALDSHFLPDVSIALDAPSEGAISLSTDVGSTLQGAISGFGAELTGNFGFEAAATVDLAYLVIGGPSGNLSIDYSVFASDGDPSSAGERFSGSISVFPAPEYQCDLCSGVPFLGGRDTLSLQPAIDDGSYLLPDAIIVTAFGGPYFGLSSVLVDDVFGVFTVVESSTGVFDVGVDEGRLRQLPFGTRLEARLDISTPAGNRGSYLLQATAVPEPSGVGAALALAAAALALRPASVR